MLHSSANLDFRTLVYINNTHVFFDMNMMCAIYFDFLLFLLTMLHSNL